MTNLPPRRKALNNPYIEKLTKSGEILYDACKVALRYIEENPPSEESDAYDKSVHFNIIENLRSSMKQVQEIFP